MMGSSIGISKFIFKVSVYIGISEVDGITFGIFYNDTTIKSY